MNHKFIMELAEQVGLIGPKSRVGDTHHAAERFASALIEALISVPGTNAIAAAAQAPQPAELSDGEIDAITVAQWGKYAVPPAHRAFARAVLAAHINLTAKQSPQP